VAGQAIYRVFIRDAAYQRVGELTAWAHLDLVLRFNDVGTWSLETASDNAEARLLSKTGGIIVTREIAGVESTIFSGFVWTEYGFTQTTFRCSGYSDDALLWQPARPTPGIPSPPWTDDYYVETNTASTVMRNLVNVNLGPSAVLPWQNLFIYFPTDPLLGSVITVRGNLQPILTLLAELAITPYAGGLGFYLRQSDAIPNKVEFIVYAPPDKSADAKFSIDLGTAAAYEDTAEAPEANHVYVMGGDGFGANRTVIEALDTDSVAEWGRRISTVIDMRGTTDTGELLVRAAEAIAGVSTLRRVSVVPFAVPSLQYGVDYDLGTLVTIVTAGGETVDLIRQVEIGLDPEKGALVVPSVGQGDGSDEERSQTITRTIQNRISNLERNWNVPPDSIDASMMVPVMKPVIGEVRWLATPAVPPGWLVCDGQGVSRSRYFQLYGAIGNIWGAGNGSTTFNVPNLRDRSPIGTGLAYGLGQYVGTVNAVVSAHSHPGGPHTHPGSHSHDVAAHSHTGAAHTHPGSHSHGGSGLAFSHNHRSDINHDHGPFSSGLTNVDTVTVGHASLGSGASDHHHNVDVPALGTSMATSTNYENSSMLGSTDPDTNAPSATFSGGTGTRSLTTDGDSNAYDALYTGQTGLNTADSVSIVHPSAGLIPVIYAGV
jgi:microcystin-dependent protein